MATREELEALKQSWLNDPCWDIETTEGFEAHKGELSAFRLRHEKLWHKAIEIGAPPGNKKLIEYLDSLETRIAKLERELHQRMQGGYKHD